MSTWLDYSNRPESGDSKLKSSCHSQDMNSSKICLDIQNQKVQCSLFDTANMSEKLSKCDKLTLARSNPSKAINGRKVGKCFNFNGYSSRNTERLGARNEGNTSFKAHNHMASKHYHHVESIDKGRMEQHQTDDVGFQMGNELCTNFFGNILQLIHMPMARIVLPRFKMRRRTQVKLSFSAAILQITLFLIFQLSFKPRLYVVDCSSYIHDEENYHNLNNTTVHPPEPPELMNGISTIKQGLSLALGVSLTTTSTSFNTATTTNIRTMAKTSSSYGVQPPPHSQLQEQHASQHSEKGGTARLNYGKGKIGTTPYFSTSADTIPLIYPGNNDIVNVITRDNILKRHNGNAQDQHHSVESSLTDYTFSSCFSCQKREKAKLDNLESIKMHILMRLQLPQLPNITAPIPVPHNILENFYKNYSLLGRRGNKSREHVKHAPGAESDASEFDYNVDNADSQHLQRHVTYNVGEQDNHSYDGNINMQKDDPNHYQHYPSQSDIIDDLYNEDEFFSQVNSVYIFPTLPRIRHNRKPEILNFKFENNHSSILRAIIHIYLRGYDWIREHEPSILEQKGTSEPSGKRREIIIAIYRAIRSPHTSNFTHTVKLAETRHAIPSGLGQWIQIEAKQLSAHWLENGNATQDIIIKGAEPWMRTLIVTGDNVQNKPFTVHIEVLTKDKRRRKRSTSLDCQESDHEVRCCRYPLKVNFTNFGWHFVVAPTSFDAYFCNGECKVGYLEQYTHTHIASLTTSASPCCSPTKMSPLSLLYFDLDQNLVWSTIPNMSVEKCSCS